MRSIAVFWHLIMAQTRRSGLPAGQESHESQQMLRKRALSVSIWLPPGLRIAIDSLWERPIISEPAFLFSRPVNELRTRGKGSKSSTTRESADTQFGLGLLSWRACSFWLQPRRGRKRKPLTQLPKLRPRLPLFGGKTPCRQWDLTRGAGSPCLLPRSSISSRLSPSSGRMSHLCRSSTTICRKL